MRYPLAGGTGPAQGCADGAAQAATQPTLRFPECGCALLLDTEDGNR